MSLHACHRCGTLRRTRFHTCRPETITPDDIYHLLPCLACRKMSVYLLPLLRYFHCDDSSTVDCWLQSVRGNIDWILDIHNTRIIDSQRRRRRRRGAA